MLYIKGVLEDKKWSFGIFFVKTMNNFWQNKKRLAVKTKTHIILKSNHKMDINHHQSEDTLELSFGCYSRKINVKCHQNDLISRKKCSNNNKWTLRKNRFHHRRKLSSSFLVLCWTSVLYLSLLPVPQNAMPVPKVEDHNSLTSAMVST